MEFYAHIRARVHVIATSLSLLILYFIPPVHLEARNSFDPDKQISVGLLVVELYQVDNASEKVTGEFVLFVTYKDVSLVQEGQQQVREIAFDQANVPVIQVKNLQNLQNFNPNVVRVFPDGTIKYIHRFRAELYQKFDFREFPLDSQIWNITLYYAGGDNVDLVPEIENTGIAGTNKLRVADWAVTYKGEKQADNENFGVSLQTIILQFELKRHVTFYFWKIFLPVFLVVCMSWSVFWINPENISAQFTVSATAILTLIVFQFSVSQLIPALPYLTRLDKYMIGTDFFVFLAFLESCITTYLVDQKKTRMSTRMDVNSRWIFPALYALFIIFFII